MRIYYFHEERNIVTLLTIVHTILSPAPTIIDTSIVNEPERNNESKVDNREASHFTNFT